jgi:single-strand DNA-binding protein
MASFNKITIVGYLGRDPELRYTPQATPVCKFPMATTERRKGKNGQYQDHTTWFRVTVWGKSAEACGQHLHKGSQACVFGRLLPEDYTDREGQKRTSLEVTADEVHFLASSDQQGQAPPRETAQPRQTTRQEPSKKEDDDGLTDNDIPF